MIPLFGRLGPCFPENGSPAAPISRFASARRCRVSGAVHCGSFFPAHLSAPALTAPSVKGVYRSTWKSEFTPGIYHPSDVVIKGRYGFDACRGSNLLSTLRQSGISLIIFCGFTTDQCVARTMKSLSREGFRCFLASDASATIFRRQQKRVEARFPSLPVAELIRWMSGSG